MDLNLGRSCSQMGPQTAPSWSQAGPKLGPIGPSWAEVGALLAEVPMLRPCFDRNGPVGRFWADLQNALFGGLVCRKWPPKLKLRQSDRSVRLHPLLHYHASAPLAQAGFEARPTRQTRISKFGQRAGDHLRLLGLFQCFPGHCYDSLLCSL